MIKRTLYFGNPAYLKTQNEQLVYEAVDSGEIKQIPVEDIGILILDNQQITITQALLAKLIGNNVAVISCDFAHHPAGLFLNLDGHSLQSQKFQAQIEASQPLKKQLWQQTIASKITNQAALLESHRLPATSLRNWALKVKSGDPTNLEATAAVYYWKYLFTHTAVGPDFRREREGAPPNHLLNYGYAVLRAVVARNLVASGLLPTLGIFHRNQYNAYCLADDIMEPYRPFVDKMVCDIVRGNGLFLDIGPAIKKALLTIPSMDVRIKGEKSPLMVAVQKTTASLAKCFEGKARKIDYPEFAGFA
ncbi:type II CRISPR-associated endonuclease Cas1 [Sediminibacterium soli]|uniref:type II CRISPR-associated endonuclease Cas1 n=1 Tax=Sediminibacterium soli TaxID=2698829 RepID=UPI00137B8840|nr:type II CRISPR-associated endonuclease Cas1 [Sediminibacterium soli]NCI47377.1 type II CRISPR-associated endonuclease Cas1 [Sediminibacterium soli]